MSIFACNECKTDYNQMNRKPLILPCGHIFCEVCIHKMKVFDSSMGIKCPSDNFIHKIEINKIPICYQILSNLPIEPKVTDFLRCARHQTKKIKFYCRTHNVFPCSVCITEHTDHEIVTFQASQSSFIAEVKALVKQVDNEKATFFHNKIKYEQCEKRMNQHYESQISAITNHFNQIVLLLKEKKKCLIGELKESCDEYKKQFDLNNKKYAKTTDLFIELANKIKHIEELTNKGDYEQFINFKPRVLHDLKAIPVIEEYAVNPETLPRFINGSTYKLNEIVGDIRAKPNSAITIRTPNVRNLDLKNEDAKSTDSISTLMPIMNDTNNNIFKQNLLTVNDNDDVKLNKDNHLLKKNDSKSEYQHFVYLTKPDQTPVSLPASNMKPKKPQTNRDNNQMSIQKPSVNNSNRKDVNKHHNLLSNKNIQGVAQSGKPKNPVNINSFIQRDINNDIKKGNPPNDHVSNGRILNTEASYDKYRKKSNDYNDNKYNPVFSIPNDNSEAYGNDDNQKAQLNKKRYVESIKSNTNSNNSNCSNKNKIAQKHTSNRSCNKSKKKNNKHFD